MVSFQRSVKEGLTNEWKQAFSRTHIPGLDELIPGFPRRGLILASGLPGSGKTIFGMSYIYYGAVEAGEPGIYVSAYESRNRFLQLSKCLGIDFEKLMEKGWWSTYGTRGKRVWNHIHSRYDT